MDTPIGNESPERTESAGAGSRFIVELARSDKDVLDSQRLRYCVFVEEMGALLPRNEARFEQDRFDPWCEHLLVRDAVDGRLVGSYRMLAAERTRETGGFYSETEFDLAAISGLRERTLEIGRACVHPAYRTGVVISLLWWGMFRYAVRTSRDYVIGCASIPVSGDGSGAAAMCERLRRECPSPPEFRVRPRRPFRIEAQPGEHAGDKLPPLIKGYVRVGAWACGDPAWDPEFCTADVLMMLPLSRMNPRWTQRLSREP